MRVHRRISLACFCVSALLCSAGSRLDAQKAAPQPAPIATQDSTNELTVAVGKSVLVDVQHPIQRVAIGLGDFATASAVTPTEILLDGKAPGETSLIIWEVGGGREFFNLSVRPGSALSSDRLEGLRRELRTELPGQPIKISADSGNIFLRGTVNDLSSSDRAVQIASTAGKVVNLLYVTVPPPDPQILLKVRFASVDRNLSRQLGINIFSTGLGNTIAGINTGEYSPPSITLPTSGSGATATLSNQLQMFAYLPGLDVGATLEDLEIKGVVEVLAEPNVLAQNGKQASFLAGGEYPFPTVQAGTNGGGVVSISFKEYGVRLNFIPTITTRGTIRLQVAPEVSSLDFANSVTFSGFEVPSIDTRKVRTEVELADGQSFAIGGLLDNRDTETYYKIPFLGDIPILGKFFQSMTKSRTNTELIVIVTPELVAPIPTTAALPLPKFPSKFLPPNSPIPMNTPDAKTAENTPKPAPATVPVETLMQSMKPETQMVIDSAGTSFGAGSSAPVSAAPPQ